MKYRNWFLLLILLAPAQLPLEHPPADDFDFYIPAVESPASIGSMEDPNARFNYELRQIVDPTSKRLPVGVFQKERDFVAKNFKQDPFSSLRTREEIWQFAGPTNVGGRTRALGIDVTNEDIIIAGGVSGNMWRTTNAGSSWAKTSHPQTINSATCLVQDTRSGKENIWYHGTGELRGNSASAASAPYRGDGIFKSIDGGQSWTQLSSTADDALANFNSPFRYVWNIVINPTKSDIDELYAAVFGGIVRSKDGGLSWHTVLGDDLLNNISDTTDFNGSNHPQFTDITVSSTGVFYAAIGAFTSQGFDRNKGGIYRSYDGENWTKISPPGLAQNLFRIVLDIAPSNENVLYFMMDGEPSQLWKYQESAQSGQTGQWTNLSNNIPDFEGPLGDYDSQGSYNMVVEVHPADQNIVFLGGTNLYRSNDGFATAGNIEWIGGYKPGAEGAPFTGHYPDQHAIAFYPSDPNRMLTGNDGGVRLTNNNLDAIPFWSELNNDYITSQFFTIALGKAGDQILTGGMQDNGSYLKAIPDNSSPWNKIWNGDGGFVATTENNLYRYYSFQNAQIFRVTLNRNLQLTSFARVDPSGGGERPGQGYLFINPYVLDPYNNNRMYLAGGDRIWVNTNLSQIPSGQNRKTSVNWISLDDTRLSSGIVSALEVSINPRGTLYYGTVSGELFKIENIDQPEYQVQQLNGSQFEPPGYVICIAADPTDANHILVIFSNYNIPSIYRSLDGGTTFEDIGANLEQRPDGLGSGPSIRWAEVVPLNDGAYKYFVGSSSGLFSMETQIDEITSWQQEAKELIGSAVVPMLDYRITDGQLAVATHGSGAFETNVENALHLSLETDADGFTIQSSYPNPFSNLVQIPFSIPSRGRVFATVFDATGRLVKNLYVGILYEGGNSLSWDGTDTSGVPAADGLYIIRINFEGTVKAASVILDR